MEDTDVEQVWRAREVGWFLAIAFTITWALHGALAMTRERFSIESPITALLYLPGLLAPSASAFIVEWRRAGRAGVRRLLRMAAPRRVKLTRMMAAIAVQPVLMGAVVAASSAPARLSFDVMLAAGQVWVVAGEEFGWRGWLWPRATRRFGPALGTALTTVAWGLWHLPMFAVAGSPQAKDGAIGFAAAIAAWGAIHGVLQRGARSVATAMIFHAATNVTVSSIEVRNATAIVAAYAVAAVAVFWWLGHAREAP